MGKVLKRILQILVGAVLTLVMTVAAIVVFVDPNQFKGIIEAETLKHSGQTLNIEGPLSWKWYPTLALEMQAVSLKNPTPFTGTILSAKIARADCAFWSIFSGKVLLNIALNGLEIALEQNAAGQANWEILQRQFPASKIKNPSSSSPVVLLNSITLNDAQLSLQDAKHQTYKIRHLSLKAKNVFNSLLGIKTPITLSFNIELPNKPVLNFSLSFNGSLTQGAKGVNFSDVDLQCTLPDGKKAHIQGDSTLDLETLVLKGNITGKALQFGKIKIDNFKTAFNASSGLIDFSPIDLKMAGILQKATLKIDMRGKIPKFILTEEANDFEVNTLLGLFDIQNKLTGTAQVNMRLNATGTSPEEWRKSLNGDLKISLANGKLYGIDLLQLLKNAESRVYSLLNSLARREPVNTDSTLNSESEKWNTVGSSNSTPFSIATATATINNGVLSNPDLSISHPEYVLNGRGTVNLVNETLQYQASVMLKNNPYPKNDLIAQYVFQTPLPVSIQGSLQNPTVRPDLKAYFNSAFKNMQPALVEKAVEQTLNKALGKILKLDKE